MGVSVCPPITGSVQTTDNWKKLIATSVVFGAGIYLFLSGNDFGLYLIGATILFLSGYLIGRLDQTK